MDRKELKKLIPFGYGKVIAERAGVSQKAVSDFLNGKLSSHKIEMAALEVAAEISEKKNQLLARIA